MKCKQYALILQLANELIALIHEFDELKISSNRINIQLSYPIPHLYINKINQLSTLYEEVFHRKLLINQL